MSIRRSIIVYLSIFVGLASRGYSQTTAPTRPSTTAPSEQAVEARRFADMLATLSESPTFKHIQTRSYEFKEAAQKMSYELFVPSGYHTAKPTPLIVALHGLGSIPSQVIRYQSLTELAEARGYIVVAPMGYNRRGWYGSLGPGGRGAADPKDLGELSETDVMNVLALVRKEFNIDPARIYLMGHSMGGGGTLYLGMKHPEIWAALGAAAPAIYSSPDGLKAITDMPVIIVQGDKDRLVKVQVTRQWVAKMKELNMNYKYIEVAGGDHLSVIVRSPENMTAIFDFFDKARRTDRANESLQAR